MARTATPVYGRTPAHKRPKGDTPLSIWLERTGTTKFTLAKALGCDPKMVGRWADGRALPGLVYAILLERVTQGGVLVYSWEATDLFRLAKNNNGVDWETLNAQRKAERKRNWRRQRGKT